MFDIALRIPLISWYTLRTLTSDEQLYEKYIYFFKNDRFLKYIDFFSTDAVNGIVDRRKILLHNNFKDKVENMH